MQQFYPLMYQNQFVPFGNVPMCMNNAYYGEISPNPNIRQVSYDGQNTASAIEKQYKEPLQYIIQKNQAELKHRLNKEKKIHPKTKFSTQEDIKLHQLVKKYGNDNWYQIAKEMDGRNIRQCRERWNNYLSPDVENGPWTKEEDELLFQSFAKYGPRWKFISNFFPTRTDINIKSRFQVHFRRYTKTMKNMLKRNCKKSSDEDEYLNLSNGNLSLKFIKNVLDTGYHDINKENVKPRTQSNNGENQKNDSISSIIEDISSSKPNENTQKNSIDHIYDNFFDLAIDELSENDFFEF